MSPFQVLEQLPDTCPSGPPAPGPEQQQQQPESWAPITGQPSRTIPSVPGAPLTRQPPRVMDICEQHLSKRMSIPELAAARIIQPHTAASYLCGTAAFFFSWGRDGDTLLAPTLLSCCCG